MIARSDLLPSVEDVLGGARFLWSLPGFLRRPIGPEQARGILRHRLERREPDFLALIRRLVYEHRPSPYRQLLAIAGCQYGDLERLVHREGVEGALSILLRHGVYLTLDELRGSRPAIRGSVTIAVRPERLRNPAAASHVPRQSSGSRGRGVLVRVDLGYLRDRAVNNRLALDARGGSGWVHALWEVPGGAAMNHLLEWGACGFSAARWFSQVDPAASGLHPRYRWSARTLRWGSLLAGAPLPRLQHVPLDDPLPIARWMAGVLQDGGIPHLKTSASSAVRLCQAALKCGLELRGARLTVSGEPVTPARLAAIARAGVQASPRYGATETGTVGYGCLAPETSDDLHFYHDLRALIQAGKDGATVGLPPRALLYSNLRPRAPLILLNATLGDHGTVVRRACGCPLEQLGWTTHLHTIRSLEKLTSGGMNFLDTDVIRVLEEVLPACFGGGPTDYQLLEEEADDGRPRLRLLVHPRVGPLDPRGVAEAFLAGIGGGSGAERVMELQWRQADFLQVERRPPHATETGKIRHLHVERGAGAASD